MAPRRHENAIASAGEASCEILALEPEGDALKGEIWVFILLGLILMAAVLFSCRAPSGGIPLAQFWVRQFGTNFDDRANGVAADGAGGAFVVGYTDGIFPGQTQSMAGAGGAFIVRYDASGNQLWLRQLSDVPASAQAKSIAVHGADGAFVVGSTWSGHCGERQESDAFIARLGPGTP